MRSVILSAAYSWHVCMAEDDDVGVDGVFSCLIVAHVYQLLNVYAWWFAS
jgi:hypothetical protein